MPIILSFISIIDMTNILMFILKPYKTGKIVNSDICFSNTKHHKSQYFSTRAFSPIQLYRISFTHFNIIVTLKLLCRYCRVRLHLIMKKSHAAKNKGRKILRRYIIRPSPLYRTLANAVLITVLKNNGVTI